MKHYHCGRNNLALTIQVPYDCPNNCPFCTAKEKYKNERPNFIRVKNVMETILHGRFPIKDVVFSGGEPSANINKLQELINKVPSNKNVYINTTLLSSTYEDFVNLVKKNPKIKGVNISRHASSFEEETALLHHIATDEQIGALARLISVRINVVLYQDIDIEKIIARWNKYSGIEISFREDYRKVTSEKELCEENYFTAKLNSLFNYINHGGCNVCHTHQYNLPSTEMTIRYHRGFEHTLIEHEDYFEYNDIIIEPNGEVLLDWEYKEENIQHYRQAVKSLYYPNGKRFSIESKEVNNSSPGYFRHIDYETAFPSCGISSC